MCRWNFSCWNSFCVSSLVKFSLKSPTSRHLPGHPKENANRLNPARTRFLLTPTKPDHGPKNKDPTDGSAENLKKNESRSRLAVQLKFFENFSGFETVSACLHLLSSVWSRQPHDICQVGPWSERKRQPPGACSDQIPPYAWLLTPTKSDYYPKNKARVLQRIRRKMTLPRSAMLLFFYPRPCFMPLRWLSLATTQNLLRSRFLLLLRSNCRQIDAFVASVDFFRQRKQLKKAENIWES